MNNKDTVFPQYRKLVNNKSYYKINSDRIFEEIQIVGSKKYHYLFEVNFALRFFIVRQ